MTRKVFTLASALLLLVCAAALALWVRSYRADLSLELSHYGSASPSIVGTIFAADVASGRLVLTREDVNLADDPHPLLDAWKFSWSATAHPDGGGRVEADQLWRFAAYCYRFGFEYSDWTAMGTRDRRVAIPIWFVVGTLMWPVATASLRGWIRLRRPRRGVCACCGYDLRASPGLCPECGTVTATPHR